jgi:hypothetical protein
MQILNVKGFTVERPDFLGKYGERSSGDSFFKEADGSVGMLHTEKSAHMQAVWDYTVNAIRHAYDELQEHGATVEEARGLLPTNIHTNIVMKANLRTLVDFFHSRISPRNLGEISRMAVAMRQAILDVHPWASIFLDQTTDKVMADLDALLKDLRDNGMPEKATAMLKLVDQLRRAG